MVTQDGGGLRDNTDKVPLELVPPEALLSMGQVLKFGASKYAKRNWERGMAWSICYACALRHLVKWFMGEDKDAESGLSHLDHALTNLAFLVTYERRKAGTDDRPRRSTSGQKVVPDRRDELIAKLRQVAADAAKIWGDASCNFNCYRTGTVMAEKLRKAAAGVNDE